MIIYVGKDYQDVSRKAANIMSAQIIMKPNAVLGLATGSTPVGFKFLHRKKFTITSKASDEYMTVIVLTHGLKFAEKFHGFRNTECHIAEKTDRITTRKKHLTAHKSPV